MFSETERFGYLKILWRGLQFWRAEPALRTWQDCQQFVLQQAAYVTQTTLFGYLRTRAGMNHFALFNDPHFNDLLRPARGQIYLVCVSDLLIFVASQLAPYVSEGLLTARLLEVYDAAGEKVIHDAIPIDRLSAMRAQFMEKCQRKLWRGEGAQENIFIDSPRALIDLAPIVDSLKEFDEEIVMNSMRFKWRSVRSQFIDRSNIENIVTDLQSL